MNFEIFNDKIKAVVSTCGAELVSVVCGGERLWQNDTGEWAGHAPVLFPVCGNCKMIVKGIFYPIPKHGFARRSEFSVVGRGRDFIVFSLQSSEETKKVYPYDFVLNVSYRLKENSIEVSYTVKNTGAEDLYFSCGSHESYAIDGEIEEYELRFDGKEELITLLHDGEGCLTGERLKLSENGCLSLKNDYFKAGSTLIFSDLRQKRAMLFHKSGRAVACVEFDADNLLLWKPERANMICIEPWLTLPDGAGDDAEFFSKKGVRRIPPNEEASSTHTVTYF